MAKYRLVAFSQEPEAIPNFTLCVGCRILDLNQCNLAARGAFSWQICPAEGTEMLDSQRPALKGAPPCCQPTRQGTVRLGKAWNTDEPQTSALDRRCACAGCCRWRRLHGVCFSARSTVQVASAEHNVPVQVFGLGTVEARVTSKSASRFPACWSIFAPMSAIVSPRAQFWPASTTASRARRSPGPKRPSSRPKPIFKGPKRASKRRKRPTLMPRASASASKNWFKALAPRSRRQRRQRQRKTPRLPI